MRSTQPTISSHTASTPVSSASSRTTASASVSPASTRPPGTDHSPAAGPRPRRTSRIRSSATEMAPTQTSGWAIEPVVDDQHAGGEAERLEEVLGLPHAGQGDGVDAEAAAGLEPGQRLVHHRLAHSDGPGQRLDIDVLDDAEPAAVGQVLDAPDQVADDDVVDGSDQHVMVLVVERHLQADINGLPPGLAGDVQRAAPL